MIFGDFQGNFHENHRENNENRKNIFFGFDKSIDNHAYKLDSKGKTNRNGSLVPLSFVSVSHDIFQVPFISSGDIFDSEINDFGTENQWTH